MFDSKFYTTMVSLVVAVVLICNYNPKKKEDITEGYVPGQIGTRLSKATHVVPNNSKLAQLVSSNGVNSQANLQSAPTARFTNVGMPAELNYSLKSSGCQHMANCGSNSLTGNDKPTIEGFTDMVREDYVKQACAPCNEQGPSFMTPPVMPANWAAGNYNELEAQVGMSDASSTLPITGMESINQLGEETQVINIDRLIYANRNSRLRGLGDPIRGDLPIVPCQAEWFRPSVNVATDLQQGALSVMGGLDGEQQTRLTNLINSESRGTESTIAGINLSQLNNITGDQSLTTIAVSSFP
jgi:hypothetical protein